MPEEWAPTLGQEVKPPDEQDGTAFKATRGGTAGDLRDMARMGKSQQ